MNRNTLGAARELAGRLQSWLGYGILAGACLHAALMAAGPPFRTDDPEPVPYHHYETYLFSSGTQGDSGWNGVGPAIEFNDGFHRDMMAHLAVPLAYSQPDGGPRAHWAGRCRAGAQGPYRSPHDDAPRHRRLSARGSADRRRGARTGQRACAVFPTGMGTEGFRPGPLGHLRRRRILDPPRWRVPQRVVRGRAAAAQFQRNGLSRRRAISPGCGPRRRQRRLRCRRLLAPCPHTASCCGPSAAISPTLRPIDFPITSLSIGCSEWGSIQNPRRKTEIPAPLARFAHAQTTPKPLK